MNDETSNSDSHKWAGSVHVAAFLTALFTSWSAGIGGMVAAFIVWMAKKDQSALIRAHAAEAFNFNFSMFLYSVIALFFTLITFGLGLIIVIPLTLVLIVVWLFCTIKAAIAGFDGLPYHYPLSIQLLH
jgi:uncharacterized Tic20 family protein